MISIDNIMGNSHLYENSGFVNAKECNELSDIRNTEELLINDGENVIFIGELSKSKKEFREFRPRVIIKANDESDQVFLQKGVDGTDDTLLIFWSPNSKHDPEIEDKSSKIRGGFRIAGGIIPHFTDNSRTTLSYIRKTHRIHHINDNNKIFFFVANFEEGEKELIEDEDLQQTA